MNLRLWRGYHEPALPQLLRDTWNSSGQLLVLCPPALENFDFLPPLRGFLNAERLETLGQWIPGETTDLRRAWNARPHPAGPTRVAAAPGPVLGVFTTGTSGGGPRLVLYTRENILASLTAIRRLFVTNRIRRIFCYPQPTHTFGLTLGYLQAQLFGADLVTAAGPYGRAAHGAWLGCADGSTLTLGVPTHFHDLIQFVRKQGRRPAASYSCIVGGARVPAYLWRELRDELGIEHPSVGYGATECAPGVAHLPPGREPREDGEIGFPLPGVDVRRDNGGLHVRGPNVAAVSVSGGRVACAPEGAVAETYLTDIVRRRAEDGVLVYDGRATSVLNRGGVKFALEPMEELLWQRLKIRAVCAAVPNARLGEELGVLIVGGIGRSAEAVKEKISSLLRSEYGVSFGVVYAEVGELPLNAGRKIDRGACRDHLIIHAAAAP